MEANVREKCQIMTDSVDVGENERESEKESKKETKGEKDTWALSGEIIIR